MSEHRRLVVAATLFVWLRIGLIMSSGTFETPDTQSYRSGQATRPLISSALLSALGNTPYVLLSASVSTVGFIALSWALWNPARRRWSYGMVAVIATVAMLPMVAVYEHWLVPDSLLVGLTSIALALASRPVVATWYPWAMVALCAFITGAKEVGVALVVLVALVLVVRHASRLAGAVLVISVLLCVVVVLPASNRHGRVLWSQPADTELTMERFRVLVAGLMWSDLSPQLAEVEQRAADCGLTPEQLLAETFRLTDRYVDFRQCPDLWDVVDDISQLDVLEAHVRNPSHVAQSVARGFAPDMYAMAFWSSYPVDQTWVLTVDTGLAVVVALLPLAALGVALVTRRARCLALVAVLASMMAVVAALLDPSSQDRHTIAFRLAAMFIALLVLTDATDASDAAESDVLTDASVGHTRPADAVELAR